MIYIVAYDISSNKRRTRVAKALQSWGYRIQKSVFQLRLDAAGLNAMRARLAALINEAEDVVHIYPPVLHLRRARRDPGRCGRARRCGAVQGGVVRD